VDETEDMVRTHYQKNPLTRKYFKRQTGFARCPIDLLPDDLCDVRADTVAGGKLYCLSFRRP
jgi:hypothetical protein